MAAALLAALFAMGVFAPAGVQAGVKAGANAPTAMLVDSDGEEVTTALTTADTTGTHSLVVEFEVDDTVDGESGGSFVDDKVTVTVTLGTWLSQINEDGTIKIEQDDAQVGTATTGATATTTGDFTLDISSGIVKDERAKVTIPGIQVAASAGTVDVKVKQGTSEGTAKVRLVDTAAAPQEAEAELGSVGTTLVVTFTAGTQTGAVVIELPYDVGTAVGIESSGTDSPTATPSGKMITIDAVVATNMYTVTVDRLARLAEGDEIKISQVLSGYQQTLPVGGGSVATDTGTTDPDDMSSAVFGTTAGKANNKADAAVALMFETLLTAGEDILGGEEISITLPKFYVPDEIDADQIIIDGNLEDDLNGDGTADDPESDDYYGPPSDVVVSGSGKTRKITLTLPTRMDNPTGTGGTVRTVIEDEQTTGDDQDDGKYTIVIKKGAGVKNPNSAGKQTIVVQDQDAATANHKFPVMIISHIAAKPGWVSRGDEVTITAKGINAKGDATAHLHGAHSPEDIAELLDMLADKELDGEDLASLPVVGRDRMDAGTAVIVFDASSSIFDAEAEDATGDTTTTSAKGTNVIIVVDGGGNIIGSTRLGLNPKVDLEVSEVRRTGKMEVTVSDWYYGDIEEITVNGIPVQLPDGPDADDVAEDWEEQSVPSSGKLGPFDVIVPRRARIGEMEVTVYGTTEAKQGTLSSQDKHVQTVNVNAFDLTLNPSTAVTDQVIRIEGTGFGERQCIISIKVGDESIGEATNGEEIGAVADCVVTDSNGELSNSFEVPDYMKPGDYTVVVTDAINRVGEAVLTIPEPEIEITPTESQRGDTVVVEGSNFPAEDLITITYSGETVTVATTDTVGDWRATFEVPVDAAIGRDHEVVAASEKKADGRPDTPGARSRPLLDAEATHHVPDEILEITPEAISSGGRLTINASNLPLFTQLSIRIGGIPAAGRVVGEDDASDGTGRYERVILVPQLTPGTHTLEMIVHTRPDDEYVTTFVEILDTVTRPTDEVFADLIAAGQLESVWRYRIDDTGSDWDSFDPQYIGQPGINDLQLVSTRDIVWIRVNANVTFQGAPLFAGWNLRTLE